MNLIAKRAFMAFTFALLFTSAIFGGVALLTFLGDQFGPKGAMFAALTGVSTIIFFSIATQEKIGE